MDKKVVKSLGVFSLCMMSVAAVLSLRNFPTMATYGWSSIGWYLIGTIFFFLPLALVAAELATTWPEKGGIFAWVKRAFGTQKGFLAVWGEWTETLVFFPTLLAFIAATVAYALFPEFAHNNIFFFIIMIAVMWGMMLFNFLGTRSSAWLSSIGSIMGTLLPAGLLILLAGSFLLGGNHIQTPFSADALVPEVSLGSLPFLASVLVLFSGMELAGFHALEAKNPQRTYAWAMLWAAALIFGFSVIGTLAIAFVVPAQEISLAGGLMQAFDLFLQKVNLAWLVVPIGLLIAIGAIAEFSTWYLGSSKGLHAVADEGSLPQSLRKRNQHGIPTRILAVQALLVSVFMMLFLFIPSINTSYWVLTAITSQVLAVMYMLIFAAAIKLRYSQPDVKRPFRVPGGKIGIWIIAGAGFLSSVFTFVIGFVPPSGLSISGWLYPVGIAAGVLALMTPPFFFHWRARRKSVNQD